MADIDRLVRQVLADQADLAPSADRLLAGVHHRASQLRRRRHATLAAGLAVAVTALVVPVAIATTGHHAPTPATTANPPAVSSAASTPTAAATAASPSGTAPASTTPTGTTALRFTATTTTTTTFPYRLGTAAAAAAGDYLAPVVTLERDALVSYHEAKDPQGDADITLVVTDRAPQFATAAAPMTEVGRRTRGKAATLRTVAVTPAAQLTLYWQESANRWVQLRTDDTFTDAEIVDFADALVAGETAVVAPFAPQLVPTDLVVATQTPSELSYRPVATPSGTAPVVTCTLYPAAGIAAGAATVTVGSDHATLTRTGTGAARTVTLSVALTQWHMTLRITVSGGYDVTDTDLIRFATGLRVTERAETTTSPTAAR